MANKVKMQTIVDKHNLKNLTPDVSLEDKFIETSDINRAALQLAGFFEHFASERMQIVGFVEYAYLEKMAPEKKEEIYTEFIARNVPCIVYCRNLQPDQSLLDKATAADIPVFMTDKETSVFTAEIIRWMRVQLAPCISIHGVLCDVYGIGVLIMGESGIGKSEAALELIKRGHRLISDDVVEIRKVSDETLVGKAPDITKHFIELRGIGIVDVKMLFGVQSVKETKNIDVVITLEEWNKEREYERLGMEENYTEFLGNKVICHNIPIRPGRNLALIVETAAINHRQKLMGYNAAQELYKRFQENMMKKD